MWEHNGCGHIKQQLNPETSKHYSISLKEGEDHEIVSCVVEPDEGECIDIVPLVKRVISNFFK